MKFECILIYKNNKIMILYITCSYKSIFKFFIALKIQLFIFNKYKKSVGL